MSKPNEILQITCVICGVSTSRRFVLCQNCYKTHKQYIKEPWFIELIQLQRFQDYIDTVERYTLDKVDSDFIPFEARVIRKRVGAPRKTTKNIKTRAKELRRKGLSFRKIGKILGISYVTVRNLVLN